MTLENRNELRRFIILVDELYQHRVKLVTLAKAATPQDLFHPTGQAGTTYRREDYQGIDEVFAFDRSVSRLIEMQTVKYLESQHETLTSKTASLAKHMK